MILTAIVLWSAYVTIIKPHTHPTPTTTEQAQNINHYEPRQTFGCMRLELKADDLKNNTTAVKK